MSTPENMTEENVTTENEATGPADAVKESRMTVNMTKEALYDFLLFHYRKVLKSENIGYNE